MEKKQQTSPYEDIIHLPHPISKRHPQMPMRERAAQFSPFAALTGHEEAVEETARITQPLVELEEWQKQQINQKLMLLKQQAKHHPVVSVCYYVPDELKEGGMYLTKTGEVRRVDEYRKTLEFLDKTIIAIQMIAALEGEVFAQQP